MKELTVSQYARLRGISAQAVYDAIGRKAIDYAKVMVQKEMTVIRLEDDEYDKLVAESRKAF